MTSLVALPNDILYSIFSFLPFQQQLSIGITCHDLNKVFIRFRYGDIRLTNTKPHKSARKLTLLLRTLLERPKLATHVFKLRISGDYHSWAAQNLSWNDGILPRSNWTWALAGGTTLSRSQITSASKHLRRCVDSDLDESQEGLWRRCKDVMASTILTLCSNLQVLQIGDGFLAYSRLLPDVLKKLDRLFPKLESMILGDKQAPGSKSIPYVDLNLITPVFQSSSLKSFYFTMAEPWRFSWSSPKAPCCRNLTTLQLVRTNITRSTLVQLLSATPNLKVFRYEQEMIYNDSSRESPALEPYLDLDELNTALTHVRHTLVELQLILRLAAGYILASECATSGVRFPTMEGRLCLREMDRLKHVEVPLVMVFGWHPRLSAPLEDILPSSIEELTLRDDLVPYCPWSLRNSSCERRATRIGRYIRSRANVAPHLVTLNVRLTSAKEILRPCLQELKDFDEAMNTDMNVIKGTKSETYAWRFVHAESNITRPRMAPRIDSVTGATPDIEFLAEALHIHKPSNTPSRKEEKATSNIAAPHSMFSSIRPLQIR